jgi:hypothetical protein
MNLGSTRQYEVNATYSCGVFAKAGCFSPARGCCVSEIYTDGRLRRACTTGSERREIEPYMNVPKVLCYLVAKAAD